MSSLHPTFPGGRSGIGLLFLRSAIAATILVQAIAYVPQLPDMKLTVLASSVFLLGCGLAVLFGLFTPFSSVIAGLVASALAFSWLPPPNFNLFSNNPLTFDVIAMSAVCLLLGPGAFSLDSHLFGRRKIVIPRSSSSSISSISTISSSSSAPISRAASKQSQK